MTLQRHGWQKCFPNLTHETTFRLPQIPAVIASWQATLRFHYRKPWFSDRFGVRVRAPVGNPIGEPLTQSPL
jgi:hypothetical protein